MPIYEYQCSKCGVFEITQRITEDPLKKCPTCRRQVQKLISNTSFQLKGTGWYITDYGRKDQGREKGDGAAKSNGSSKSSDAASTKSTESKPGDSKSTTGPSSSTSS